MKGIDLGGRLRMPIRRFVQRVIVGLLAVPAVAITAAPQTAPRIAARDQLAITVFNGGAKEETYSVKVAVDVDGTFEYPTLGRIKAGNLTAREVETDLKTRLEKYL